MADNGAVQEKEKLPIDDPESAFAENEMDDSKAKFINGGMDDTKVVISGSDSSASFVGLDKEELKKYAEDPFWVRLRWILFILFWVGWLAMLVSAIVIIVLAPRCPSRPDLKWYHKDVAYNAYSKSFLDGDKPQDGYGDLEGIKKKEEYIGKSLNAKVIWLSSIFATDGNNDRAIMDHKMLDKKFGTVDALSRFCKKLLKAGKQVIIDLIPNQTSRNHTWFTASQGNKDKYASYYVWSTTNPGWTRADGSDMWVMDPMRNQYYLSQFAGTADLNLSNADVIAEFKEIIQFWASVGVNGFHINDLEYLTENSSLSSDNTKMMQTRNFAANADVIDSLRTIVDGLDNKPGREKLLFGTLTSGDADTLALYTGGEGKKGLHMVSVVLDQLTRDVTAQKLQEELEPYIATNKTRWLGWRLTTPDGDTQRVFSRVGGERMTVAHALQALLPGSSMPYYGDEIGMDNGRVQGKETISPMQWTKGDNAGFSSVTPWTPVNAGYEMKNVDSMTAQLRDNKMMDSVKELGELRNAESLQFGKTRFCSVDDLLIFSRHAEGFPSFVVVVNLGETTTHKFQGDQCFGDRKSAELVFISPNSHHAQMAIDLGTAIEVEKNEVQVFKFPA